MQMFTPEVIEAFGFMVTQYGEIEAMIAVEVMSHSAEYAADLRDAWAQDQNDRVLDDLNS